MRIEIFGISAAFLSLFVFAHSDGIQSAPRVLGQSRWRKLKSRSTLVPKSPTLSVRSDSLSSKPHYPMREKHRRQEPNVDGPCGNGAGNCASGYCCSEAVSPPGTSANDSIEV
jgi:hypothetical protein